MKIFFTCFIAVIALFSVARARAENGPAEEGDMAPAWKLPDLAGKTVSSDDFKGKVMVLDFWATWCPPCRAEIPGLVNLQKTYQKHGLVVVGISLDEGGLDVLNPLVKKFGMNYPVVVGDDKVQAAFGGIDAIPVTLIIDRQRRIIKRHLGLTEKSELEEEIKPFLKSTN